MIEPVGWLSGGRTNGRILDKSRASERATGLVVVAASGGARGGHCFQSILVNTHTPTLLVSHTHTHIHTHTHTVTTTTTLQQRLPLPRHSLRATRQHGSPNSKPTCAQEKFHLSITLTTTEFSCKAWKKEGYFRGTD